jgi:hypothetical protein
MDRSDEQLRRDLIRHGEAISAIVTDAGNTKDRLLALQNGIQRERDVREIKDEHLNERLDDIEKSIGTLNKIGWWILATFGGSFIAALSSFIYGGGLKLAHP